MTFSERFNELCDLFSWHDARHLALRAEVCSAEEQLVQQREEVAACALQLTDSLRNGVTSPGSLAWIAGLGFLAAEMGASGEVVALPPPVAPASRWQSVMNFLSDIPAIVASIATFWPPPAGNDETLHPQDREASRQPDADIGAAGQYS